MKTRPQKNRLDARTLHRDLKPQKIHTPVVALDLGESTGWACRTQDGELHHGTEVFKLARGESEGMRYRRFRAFFVGKLLVKVDAPGPKPVIAFEAPHHRGGASTAAALGYRTVVLEEAAGFGLDVATVHTATLKKHATGFGGSKKRPVTKDQMRAAALKRWWLDPSAVKSHDETDALCVLAWMIDQIGER